MPVILSGTGILALAGVVRCLMEGTVGYSTLGAIVVVTEILFIQLARRLQGTAREMLIFKAEREALITQLDGALNDAEDARLKAEEANQAKSRFLATMSHELRTPLNAILGFSEILSKEMMGPHAVPVYKSYSDDIHHSGDYLLRLINDILDLSRIEANRQDLDFSRQSIRVPKPRTAWTLCRCNSNAGHRPSAMTCPSNPCASWVTSARSGRSG
jgi:two-component system cell cycle sensor histidine kinase PleC